MDADDWDETLPPSPDDRWNFGEAAAGPSFLGSIIPYTRNRAIFVCPSSRDVPSGPLYLQFHGTPASSTSYLGNGVVMALPLGAIPEPAEIVYLVHYRSSEAIRSRDLGLAPDTGPPGWRPWVYHAAF